MQSPVDAVCMRAPSKTMYASPVDEPMKTCRCSHTVEALRWTDTDENRALFTAWFDSHGSVFETRGAKAVLPEGVPLAEREWILFPHDEFIGMDDEMFTDTCLANKLIGSSRCWVLDADATIMKWRRRLAEQRLREGRGHACVPTYIEKLRDRAPLTAGLAREIWEAFGSLFEDESDESLFIKHALQIDGIDWVSDQPWEDTVHCYSHEYKALVDFLLPALAKGLCQDC
jgi:hypothetical protein